ncbi:MAG: hypothetical protein V1848_00525 [Candidatus Magasanikbacteria bacterium]
MIGEPKPDMGSPKAPEVGVENKESVEKLRERIDKAIELAVKFGGIDGSQHKTWVIDQMVRVLAGEKYDEVVKDAKDGEDGPDTYSWDEGIAP